MSYRNIKKNFNISDADYHRLPKRRQKFYSHNATAVIETARVYPTPAAQPVDPFRREVEDRRERHPDLLDTLVTGAALGAGMAIGGSIINSLFGDSDSSSSSSPSDVEFGGGDFGGAGAGGEW